MRGADLQWHPFGRLGDVNGGLRAAAHHWASPALPKLRGLARVGQQRGATVNRREAPENDITRSNMNLVTTGALDKETLDKESGVWKPVDL